MWSCDLVTYKCDFRIIFWHLSSSTCRNPPTTVATLTGSSSARNPVSLKATRTWLTLWTRLPLMASLSLTLKWTPFWRNETFWPGSSKPAPLQSQMAYRSQEFNQCYTWCTFWMVQIDNAVFVLSLIKWSKLWIKRTLMMYNICYCNIPNIDIHIHVHVHGIK